MSKIRLRYCFAYICGAKTVRMLEKNANLVCYNDENTNLVVFVLKRIFLRIAFLTVHM